MLKSLILGAMMIAATPAVAAEDGGSMLQAAMALTPNRYVWTDPATSPVDTIFAEPVSIVVSIADQRAYVYRGETLVAASSVSTGKADKATPTGTYTILQKKEAHRSNLYNNASMPFMQRLTWDGIAIHAGRNPGFPDSHGCIRVPAAFAKKLFAVTDLGTTVTVTEDSIDPAAPPPPTMAAVEGEAVANANAAQLASLDR